ncbi:MAG TPA: hypothetical protein K8U80_10245 [Collinsella ihuae]|uniref:KOW domain-containing protein n=1 Tax=Collinsella ihumii TaxID=1720204 RepID=A0A921IR82_9ACTN|nr:hypothetical protein [Collinsella ihumii]
MPMWYVIQVINGREELMAGLISRVVSSDVCQECFSPKFATEMKVRGRWVPCERNLLPGYLIAITDQPKELQRCLSALDEFARVLTQGGAFAPLAKEETSFIDTYTKPHDRVVPMSLGIKEGDRVVVTQGPLVGHEGLIREINRRKSVAYLEFNLCGRRVSTRVGLGVLSKEKWLMREFAMTRSGATE